MTYAEIGRALGADPGMIKRAIRWMLGDTEKQSSDLLERPLAIYKRFAGEALRLREQGLTLQEIGDELGFSIRTAHLALKWAKSKREGHGESVDD